MRFSGDGYIGKKALFVQDFCTFSARAKQSEQPD
jgi:hypothetical protein